MNKRLSVLIWAGAGIVILVALFALFGKYGMQLAMALFVIYLHFILFLIDEINLIGTFLLVALMLGLIWWKWTTKKKQDKAARTISLRILDNPNGIQQWLLSNLPKARPNAQRRIKKTIREELRWRPADEIASMVLNGGAEMQELMDEMLPQMPIEIRRDINRAIEAEERCCREAREKAARTIALRILDNLDGTRQRALSNLQTARSNAQQCIKKAIREELRRRPADEIASMVLDGGAEMRELMDEMLPQMPIEIRRNVNRAIEAEERHRREAREKAARTIALRILDNLDGTRQRALSNLQTARPNAQQRIKKAIREELRRRPVDEIALMILDGVPEIRALMDEMLLQMPTEIRRDIERAIKEKQCRRETREEENERRRREAQEIDQLFAENIERNTDKIARRFFSGEFQDREYVIKKIWETSTEFQRRLENAISKKQSTLLKNPQTRRPGNAFVYLIRQEDFANEQFLFKIGWAKDPRKRLKKFLTGNPHFLHLWAAMPFPDDAAARRKERKLHRGYRSWKKRGEWFQGRALEKLLQAEDFTPYFNIPPGP